MRTIMLIALLIFGGHMLMAQDDSTNYELHILARSLGDEVELRWAPTAKETWLMGNQDGYLLERRKNDGNGWQQLAEVKPYTLEEWKAKTDTTNDYVSIAAMTLLSRRDGEFKAQNFSQYMLAAQEGDNKFAFALMAAEYSQEAATGLGLYYKDTDIRQGEIVRYRISVIHRDEPYSGDTAEIRVFTASVYEPQQVTGVIAEPADGSIKIVWSRPMNTTKFSGYFLERSSDNQRNWTRLNERPYVYSNPDADASNNNYEYTDTNVINYKPYHYRIIGITPFGDEGLPSEVIKTEGIDLTAPIPPSMIYVEEVDRPGIFRITWDATTNAPDHAGFYVGRSARVSGPFEKLTDKPLSLRTREFLDDDPLESTSVYYTVFSVDDKGNEHMSPIAVGVKTDSIPPAQVSGLTGAVDSLGGVLLAWDMNSEKDLKGYRVYRGNLESHEFIQLTAEPVPGNFYFDTISLRTLTKTIYYKVVAVDYHYNPSPYSSAFELKKPDFLPPASPTFTDYLVSSDGIALTWKTSPSDDAVVQGLYRRTAGEGWIILNEFADNTTTAFKDTSLETGKFYEYTLVAVDDAGLYSERAKPVRLPFMDNGVRPGVTNIKAAMDRSCACFKINWEFQSAKDHHIVIFRDEDQQGLEALTTLPSGTLSYADKDVYAYEGGYVYQIKVVYADGGESPMSVPVIFKPK